MKTLSHLTRMEEERDDKGTSRCKEEMQNLTRDAMIMLMLMMAIYDLNGRSDGWGG